MNGTKLVHFSDITLLYIYTRANHKQLLINKIDKIKERKSIQRHQNRPIHSSNVSPSPNTKPSV